HPRRHAETAPATPRRAGATVDPRDPLAVLVHGKTSMPVVPEGAIVVRAPMQGTVVAIDVSPGDAVPAGAQLLVMEAMKMEHVVAAPVGGIVRALHAAARAGRGADRADARGRTGRGDRPGERPPLRRATLALRRDGVRLYRPRRHAGHPEPPEEGSPLRAGIAAAAAGRLLHRGRRRPAGRHRRH